NIRNILGGRWMKRTQRTRDITEGARDMDPQALDALYNSAKSILNTTEKEVLGTVLFSSVNDAEGTFKAASHISYIITQLERKVLLVILDLEHFDELNTYFETDGVKTLIDTVSTSSYLREAIRQTQY